MITDGTGSWLNDRHDKAGASKVITSRYRARFVAPTRVITGERRRKSRVMYIRSAGNVCKREKYRRLVVARIIRARARKRDYTSRMI